MSVTVKIPTRLRDLAGGAASVQAEGETVGAAGESVFERRTAGGRNGEDGDLRRFINVYLGGEDIRFLDGLDTAVPAGGELTTCQARGRRLSSG